MAVTTAEPLDEGEVINMAFALWAKQIKCSNCNYQGKAEVLGSGCGLWLTFLALFIVSFWFLPWMVD